jgi:predicted acylesterase/phospholipase RssA
MLAEQRQDPPLDPLVEEVRVAMALNGGVSLAIWMGGCAVELDCARRAHVGHEPLGAADAAVPDRTVYHALCAAFRRELVIDLMSGSSAGGINGALLAAAIHRRRRLDPDYIREQWMSLGDFGRLLRKTSDPEPTSLMNGAYFHESLSGIFEELLERAEPAAHAERLANDVKLDITTTDVEGQSRRFRDEWGEELVASEYRQRFEFREDADFTVERLATAARSSASFPIAFEPWQVGAGQLLPEPDGERWVVDGGLLDNAPIRAVLELIPSRAAERQVKRFVCYMNADPALPPAQADGHDQPPLPRVLGYVLNLPRNATFVDHLTAIERAVNQGMLAGETELPLLALDRDALFATAGGLLPAYRLRRRLLSLADVLDQPSLVEAAARTLGQEHELPWIPAALEPPGPPGWGWGVGAARRVIHLVLDLIRLALRDAPPDVRTDLFAARIELDGLLAELDEIRAEITDNRDIRELVETLSRGDDAGPVVRALRDLMEDERRDPALRGHVRAGAAVALRISPLLQQLDGVNAGPALFGSGWTPELARRPLDEELFAAFLRRTLAVEVTRRAFSADEDVESAQQLRFAQLTPCAPALLFAPAPLDPDRPIWNTPDTKLTGVKLGHFAAFYRASWRANDYMWGRLDAAVRVVDLLVDTARARQVAREQRGPPPWELLADALLPDGGSPDQHWLVAEVLGESERADEPLAAQLSARLRDDLCNGDGRLTRTICARAAQLEILAHELPVVVRSSVADTDLGTAGKPIDLPTAGPWRETIERIRAEGDTFPERLGRDDPDELASALALRTTTHAAFVSLAGVRTARLPLARFLYMLRGPLLPVAGLVSRSVLYRIAVVLAYWAVAMYVVSRLVTTKSETPRLGALWSWPTLATYVAALGVAAVVFVPALRGARASSPGRRWSQWAWAAALAAAGGAVALVWALASELEREQVLVQAGAEAPPTPLVILALAVALGLPVALPIPPIRKRVNALLERPWGGPVSLALTLGPWLVLGGFSLFVLVEALSPFDAFHTISAALALAAAPLLGLGYLAASGRLRPRHAP